MKYLLCFLVSVSFFAFGEEVSKTGILPRDLPQESQPKEEESQKDQKSSNSQDNLKNESRKEESRKESRKEDEEEIIPLMPEKPAQPSVEKQVLEVSGQNQKSESSDEEEDQSKEVKGSDFQNIYSAPIIIEENQRTSKDFVNEYNNNLIESAPIYQQMQESFSSSYKYRWGISADITPFRRDGSFDLVLLDLGTQFGWMFSNNFEVGPFISVDMEYRVEGVGSALRRLDLIAGGFMEYNFVPYDKQQFLYPAIGFQLGYNRNLNHNRLYARPYVIAKSFLSNDLALVIDFGFDWRSRFNYAVDDIWSISTNIGFLKYF